MLSGYPVTDAKFKNYQHNLFTHPAVKDYHMDNLNIFDLSNDVNEMFNIVTKSFIAYAENIYNEDVVKELYEKREEFDLLIVDRIVNEVRELNIAQSRFP